MAMARCLIMVSVLSAGMVGCNHQADVAGDPPIPQGAPLRTSNYNPKKPAPDTYRVQFETTAGDFLVEVHREWAPRGADRFYELVQQGFYNDCGFFRVIPGFMVQFGINGDPSVQKQWRENMIPDDPVVESNTRGTITFATSGPDSRTTQIFINYGDNQRLDQMGFAPFGRVIEGMDAVEAIHSGYRERPNQEQIQNRGNEYLKSEFPKLDYVVKAALVENTGAGQPADEEP